jgi:quercetin dioxygenase-like cupin family protein
MTIRALQLSFGTVSLAIAMTTAASAAELNPVAVVVKRPADFVWRDPTDMSPANNTILHGDPNKPGFYVAMNKFKPGRFGVPHYHPNDRFIAVISGTWWKGSGKVKDPAHTQRLPALSFGIDYGLKVHWDGTKDEPATVLIMGDGPATNIEAGQEQGTFTGPDPTMVKYWTSDEFKWRDPSNAAPINQAVLAGDPSKEGIYVQLIRYKPGAYSRPHFHPNDGFVTVLKGPLLVGTGTKFDTSAMVAMPTGTFMQHIGKQVHYQGAKDEEALILVGGHGPATATPAEEK